MMIRFISGFVFPLWKFEGAFELNYDCSLLVEKRILCNVGLVIYDAPSVN